MSSAARKSVWTMEVQYCAAIRYHDKLLGKQQQHERLTQILQSKGFTVHIFWCVSAILVNFSEAHCRTSSLLVQMQIGISKLASPLSTHAQKSMQSIIQGRRVSEPIPQQSVLSHCRQFEPP